jgi:hypothetical protein
MSLDVLLVTNRNCDRSVAHLNRAFAIREWLSSRIGIPQNGHGTIEVTKELLFELLESCNLILSDTSLAEKLIPVNTNDFDPDQDYNDDYFSQIEEVQEQLDHLFRTWDWNKPLYYYEWF